MEKHFFLLLLLAREQFYLDLIQRYLKGPQSIFKNVTGQLVVFSTILSLACIAQPRLFSSIQLQRYGEEPTAKVAVQRIGAQERQQFYLGVSSQEVGTNKDVKGVSVQHSAVLGHSFVAKTNSQVDSPQEMDGTAIPYSYGHSFSFLESL